MSNGKWTERPEGAAQLFDSESGRAAARKRWDKHREQTKYDLIEFVKKETGEEEVSFEDAVNYTLNTPQFRAALDGKTAAAKLLYQIFDLVAQPEPQKQIVQDQRQVHLLTVIMNDREAADRYIEQLKSKDPKIAAYVEAQIPTDEEGPYELEVPIND